MLGLESVFEDLKSKVADNDELETLTNISMQDIREGKEERKQAVNIYKPTLKKQATS